VSLTDRDRKILLALVPLALIIGYWFLLLSPKREEASKIQDQLSQAQTERDTAVQRVQGLSAAKRDYANDYATVIYLGKSIPSTVDMPSLIVQLDRASRGTGIDFTSIKAGTRSDSSSAAPAASSTSTSTSTPPSGSGATPAANGGGAAAGGGSTTGLDTVPLDFEFNGSFFDLADFFHRMKRFVRVANDQIVVRGRLMTINSFSFEAPTGGSSLKATVHASVYLSPKTEGVSGGATPQGPAGATPSGTQSASSSPSTPPAPAASVIAR
jgi:Tfp pilus assembly protein PilO